MEPKYKDFRASQYISYDIETYDPNLTDFGPGVFRKDGYMLGFSLADETGFAEYYNVGHPGCTEFERKKNLAYLRETLALPQPKIGVKIQYDINWTEQGYNIPVAGTLIDICIAEALLDENLPHYDLDTMAKKYCGIGKQKGRPETICEKEGWKGDFRKHLYKMSYADVYAYGVADAALPIKIYRIQRKLMEAQELIPVFDLENKITRILLIMYKNGVRIDVAARDQSIVEIKEVIKEKKKNLYTHHGEFNYNSSKQIAALLDSLDVEYQINEKTKNPILDAHALRKLEPQVPFVADIIIVKKLDKILSTFLEGSLTKALSPDGRIHCSFYNTKTETEGGLRGTRSGRFSSANPNLQQIPSFDKKEKDDFKRWYTGLCRKLFIPEEGMLWGKTDYSQIEYRFMAHFACGPGSLEVREQYNEDPHTDYHGMIEKMTGLPRKLAKNLNFGVGYGMGANHMAEFFGWDMEYCYEMLNTYHSKAPFIKATMKQVEIIAKSQMFIRTFLKRRSHLVDTGKAYTMFCRLCQGSAADLVKQAAVNIYDAGLLDVLTMHLTVHDEYDVSIPQTKIGFEAFAEMNNLMEHALKLKVPVIAEAEVGPNWADLRPFDLATELKGVRK